MFISYCVTFLIRYGVSTIICLFLAHWLGVFTHMLKIWAIERFRISSRVPVSIQSATIDSYDTISLNNVSFLTPMDSCFKGQVLATISSIKVNFAVDTIWTKRVGIISSVITGTSVFVDRKDGVINLSYFGKQVDLAASDNSKSPQITTKTIAGALLNVVSKKPNDSRTDNTSSNNSNNFLSSLARYVSNEKSSASDLHALFLGHQRSLKPIRDFSLSNAKLSNHIQTIVPIRFFKVDRLDIINTQFIFQNLASSSAAFVFSVPELCLPNVNDLFDLPDLNDPYLSMKEIQWLVESKMVQNMINLDFGKRIMRFMLASSLSSTSSSSTISRSKSEDLDSNQLNISKRKKSKKEKLSSQFIKLLLTISQEDLKSNKKLCNMNDWKPLFVNESSNVKEKEI